MTDEAIQKRREYQKEYYKKNKEHISQRHKNWRDNNKDKIKQYNKNYWEKLVQQN